MGREGDLLNRFKELFEMERNVNRLMCKSAVTIYDNSGARFPAIKSLYKVVFSHLSGNTNMRYTLVDKYRLVDRPGEQTLAIREMPVGQIEKLKGFKEWYTPDMRVYFCDFSVDVNKFFRKVNEISSWKELLNLWVTENCKKDERLVTAFKSVVIPLTGKPEAVQPLNNHQFWLTNTGTGKTTFSLLLGGNPNLDYTEAGLFGGNIDEYRKQQVGLLNGSGVEVIDEANTLDSPIMIKLLNYMEQGVVQRNLKIPIVCRGTKTIIMTSNPRSNDLLESFLSFMKIVCTAEHPKRLGRRIGLFLIGNDYKMVDDRNAITAFRGLVSRIIKYSVVKNEQNKINRILAYFKKWVFSHDDDTAELLKAIASKIPNESVREFVEGTTYSLRKLKASSIRLLMLEYLDKIVLQRGYRDVCKLIDEEKEDVYKMLVSINIDSLKKISYAFEHVKPTPDGMKILMKKFPTLSLRELAKILGVHHTTVYNWLNPKEVTNNSTG
jgi:hypothetical protein